MTKKSRSKNQNDPANELEAAAAAPARSQRISHRDILLTSINLTGIADIYRQKVLTQPTRTIRLLGRKSSAQIIHTLLGFEVQASYKRIQCPDLVTARYLKLFSEIGCHSIKLPYDPTLTEQIIPALESMVEAIRCRIQELFPQDRPTRRYALEMAFATIRRQLRSASMP